MMMCMADFREFDEVTSDPDYNRRVSNYTLPEQYRAFRQALYDTAWAVRYSHSPTVSVTVLETIHAMWILSVIILFSHAHEDRSYLSLVFGMDFAPVFDYLETRHMTLDEICDAVYSANPHDYSEQTSWGQSQIRNTYFTLDLYRRSISGAAGIDGSGPTVAKIFQLLFQIADFTRYSVTVTPLGTTHEK